jgi:site-specific DNA-methyltransferase (adenine-specific)
MKPYYEHDGITIYHGDCREVLPAIEPADLVLMDPPYGHGKSKWSGGSWASNEIYNKIKDWDRTPVEQQLIDAIIAMGAFSIIWGGNYYTMPPSRAWLVWEKVEKMETMADFEMAWTNLSRPGKLMCCRRNQDGKREHPTQKPVRLLLWCIQYADRARHVQTILDPFMGSGTTLRAAKDLGRKAIGIEIDEEYCEIAARRLAQEVLF